MNGTAFSLIVAHEYIFTQQSQEMHEQWNTSPGRNQSNSGFYQLKIDKYLTHRRQWGASLVLSFWQIERI